MKRLLLAAIFGLLTFAASASTPVQINNILPVCPGSIVTVQWVCYDYTTCGVTLTSPVYNATPGAVYDLDNPTTWGGAKPPSYSLYAAIVCVDCGGGIITCLPPVFSMPTPCGPTAVGPIPVPCCPGSVSANFVAGGGGGIAYVLNIQP
jgi:hypothetical protein